MSPTSSAGQTFLYTTIRRVFLKPAYFFKRAGTIALRDGFFTGCSFSGGRVEGGVRQIGCPLPKSRDDYNAPITHFFKSSAIFSIFTCPGNLFLYHATAPTSAAQSTKPQMNPNIHIGVASIPVYWTLSLHPSARQVSTPGERTLMQLADYYSVLLTLSCRVGGRTDEVKADISLLLNRLFQITKCNSMRFIGP